MKLLIQLTFNNGLGNLYCGAVEVLHFVQKYKNLGYECELIFASNGTHGGNKFIGFLNFEDIFDLESFKIFNRIRSFEHSISDKEFEGYTYHSTQYGPNHPGAHWWDVFFDVIPDEVFPKHAYNMETLISNQHVPFLLPKFNKKVYQKTNKFRKKNKKVNKSIQVRYYDYNINVNDDFKLLTKNIYDKLLDSKNIFHLSSNNQYLIDTLKSLNSIKTYEYKHLDILPNDHSYFFYHRHIDNSILLERIYDNLSEMVLLSYYDEIYYYTSFSWITTFLYYSRSNNPTQKLININSNIDLIK
jgi:hypothetical protein